MYQLFGSNVTSVAPSPYRALHILSLATFRFFYLVNIILCLVLLIFHVDRDETFISLRIFALMAGSGELFCASHKLGCGMKEESEKQKMWTEEEENMF
jgi:hypothetical protein